MKGRNEESDYRRKREIRLGITVNEINWAKLVKSNQLTVKGTENQKLGGFGQEAVGQIRKIVQYFHGKKVPRR